MVDKTKEQIKIELQESLLDTAYEENEKLRLLLEEAKKEQLEFRDDVALEIYAKQFKDTPDYTVAAVDAYRAADAFLRVRDTGEATQLEPNNSEK